MKFLPISDLHFEFQADKGRSFVESLPPADVVILAGDIAVGDGIPAALALFCNKYPRVVYVHGNHEYYYTTYKAVQEFTQLAVAENSNLVYLDGTTTLILANGERILGGTLWFPRPLLVQSQYDRAKLGMTDFKVIADFEDWVYPTHDKMVQHLTDNLQEGDIVITHHLPSYKSVNAKWQGDLLNHFFVGDVEHLILARKPKLWIHGHTHDSCDYMLGDTRVVCNPFGYAGVQLNQKFDDALILEY